jgi:hypothetical protein
VLGAGISAGVAWRAVIDEITLPEATSSAA